MDIFISHNKDYIHISLFQTSDGYCVICSFVI